MHCIFESTHICTYLHVCMSAVYLHSVHIYTRVCSMCLTMQNHVFPLGLTLFYLSSLLFLLLLLLMLMQLPLRSCFLLFFLLAAHVALQLRAVANVFRC